MTLDNNAELPKLEEDHPLRLAVEKLKLAGKVSSDSIENLSKQEVPIMALISDGIFKIEGVENQESMTMIQKNYAGVNLICNSRIAGHLGPTRSIFCSLLGAEPMTDKSSQWCITRHLCEILERLHMRDQDRPFSYHVHLLHHLCLSNVLTTVASCP